MMAHGGARNGSGRKKGARDRYQAAAAATAAEGGELLPLPFFLGEMRRLVKEGKPKEAFPYAREALPYCHKKLPSDVNVDVSVESTQIVELLITTREQADQAIAALADSSGIPRQ